MRSLNHCLRTGRFLYCLALFLISCTAPGAAPAPDSNALATSDLRPALTPTAIPLPAPTSTSAPVATETASPLPTLLPDEAEALILDLYQNNRGCLLPCWWGSTPGQTEWQATETFLGTFATKIYGSSGEDAIFAEVYLPNPQETPAFPIRDFYTVQGGIITMIEAHVPPTPTHTPSAILSTYGQPDEVWLLTANSPREGFLGFVMTLFYPQHGFMLSYGSQGTIEGGMVRSCFPESTYDEMVLATWVPQEKLAYAEASSRTVSFGTTEYDRPLEEATGMSLDSFYETFSRPDEPLCLETPADLWPGP